MAWLALPVLAGRFVEYGPPPQNESERQHGGHAEDADADMSVPPTDLGNEVLDDRRPDHTGKRAADSGQGDGEAAVPIEPKRGVRHQRREARRAAKADGQTGDDRECGQGRGVSSEDVAEAHEDRATGKWR